MYNDKRLKPGDKIFRPRRIKRYRLRRILGVPALFSAGYGNVGSSIYYALGIVALVAMGATPVALGIAGVLFIFTALTYAEGTAMLPEAGGSASFARHAFNDTAAFTAGWALMLSYIVTISISAYTIPPYLGYFLAEETKQPEKRVPSALILMIITVLVIFAGISLVSLSAMSPQELASEWSRDPVAGIAASLPLALLREILKPLIAILAGTILLIATNAGIMGISRLAFSLGSHRLEPSVLSRVHHRFKTPYISIILFSIVALFILIPGFFAANVFENMGALYAFGSLLAFMFAHASILNLRARKPDLPRPFKLGWNLRIKGKELPLSAILGLCATATIWIIILITQPYSRWIGISWMVVGFIIFYVYRRKEHLPLNHSGRE